jgi:hypothetical protein
MNIIFLKIFKVRFQNRRIKAGKQSHNSSSSGSTPISSLSSIHLSSKIFSTNPALSSSSFHQMFNGRTHASTSSPTSIMMTTDSTMLYASFPPSSCDFRSTMISKQNKKIVFKTLIFSFL